MSQIDDFLNDKPSKGSGGQSEIDSFLSDVKPKENILGDIASTAVKGVIAVPEAITGFLRNAQDKNIRKAISSELARRRREEMAAMPDPLQQSLIDQPKAGAEAKASPVQKVTEFIAKTARSGVSIDEGRSIINKRISETAEQLADDVFNRFANDPGTNKSELEWARKWYQDENTPDGAAEGLFAKFIPIGPIFKNPEFRAALKARVLRTNNATEAPQAVQSQPKAPQKQPRPLASLIGGRLTDTDAADLVGEARDPLRGVIQAEPRTTGIQGAANGLPDTGVPAVTGAGDGDTQRPSGVSVAGRVRGRPGKRAVATSDAELAQGGDDRAGDGGSGTGAGTAALNGRPARWRQNALQAKKVARELGLNPEGKRLAQIVAEIDAFDARSNVQNTPQGTERVQAQAPADQAPEAARGDGAETGRVPDTRAGDGVRADGVGRDQPPVELTATGMAERRAKLTGADRWPAPTVVAGMDSDVDTAAKRKEWKKLWSRVPVPATDAGAPASSAEPGNEAGPKSAMESSQSTESSVPAQAAQAQPTAS